jgi:putative phosphoesterase
MTVRILIISDIHGNYPALAALSDRLPPRHFNHIINCGDSTVYTPFANETLQWLQEHKVLSILGNTDKKVIKLLRNKTFAKPGKQEKRIMYQSTADTLTTANRSFLLGLPKCRTLKVDPGSSEGSGGKKIRIGIFHGSPAHHHEFLFDNTPDSRFVELAAQTDCHLVLTGHSHTPYHKVISGVHFINPGSAGRMFDGDPRGCCATLEISGSDFAVHHYRIDYDIAEAVDRIRKEKLPEIYCSMLKQGKKLN